MKRARTHNSDRKGNYKKKRYVSVKQQVQRELNKNVETKYFDATIGDSPTVTAGLIIEGINDMNAGTGSTNRVGRNVTVKKVMYKGVVTLPSTSVPTETHDVVRLIIVQDKGPQLTPVVSGVGGILQAATVYSYKNMEESNRFVTIIDKVISISSVCGAYDGTNDQFGENSVSFEYYKDVNFVTQFAADADPSVNALTALIISLNGLAIVEGTTRVRYTDL